MAEAAADPVLLTFTNCESWMLYIETKLRGEVDLNEYCSPSLWDYLRGSLDRDSFFPGTDEKVLKEIRMSCSQEMLPHILYAEYAAEAWKWLADHAVAASTEEKARYYKMMGTAIASRAKANEVPEVDKVLTKRNYGKWKNYMKNVLLSKCLWEVVDGSESIGSRSYKTKNHNALITIRISCGEEMLDHAREAWLKLADKLEGAVTSTMERKKGIDNVDHVLLTVSFNLVERNRYILSGNYEIWKDCMQTYLKGRGLWGFMEESVISDHVKDEEALDAIKLSCGSEMLSYILYMDCARHAWEKLAEVAALSTTEEG